LYSKNKEAILRLLRFIILIFIPLSMAYGAHAQNVITTLTVNGTPVAPTGIQVCSGDSVIVNFQTTGGTAPYTYNLINTNDPNIHFTSGLSSMGITGVSSVQGGSFTIQVIDATGPVETLSGFYTVISQVSAGNAPTSTQFVCSSSPPVPLISFMSGAVTSGGTWTYDPFGTPTPVPSGMFDPQTSPSGYYQYSVTNGVCPPVTKFFQIQTNNSPNISAGTDIQAAALSSVQLQSIANGGTPPYTYNWSPSTGLSSTNSPAPFIASLNQAQLYQVTVTDANGCQATDDVLVTMLTSSVTAYAPQTTFDLCPSESDTIVVIPSGGSSSNYSISWTPATAVSNSTSFTPTITATSSTTITGIVTDGFVNDTVVIQVNFPPAVNFQFQPVQDLCITYGNFNISAVSPQPSAGGYFTGTGVDSLGNFSPAIAGLGAHVITYTYVSPFGCVYSGTQTINVYPPHFVGFNPIAPVCADASPFSITGGITEPGLSGTYSGVGVQNGVFYPQNVGPGTYQITYSVNNAGCLNTATTNIVVYPLPVVTIDPFPAFCEGDSAYTLTEGSPPGGTYSGIGVSNGVFYPDSMNGQFFSLITYTYTDSNGCTNSADRAIQVFPKTNITVFNPPTPICAGSPSFTMSGGSPTSGGSYSGPGITNNIFNPSAAGIGSHTVYYTITSSNGCVTTDSAVITVTPGPSVQLNLDFTDICIDQPSVLLTGGSPAGGTYSGFGVTNGQFFPSLSGVGPRIITYTYTDPNGCIATATQSITVRPKPTVSINPVGPFCVTEPPVALNFGQPAGGTYSGLGVLNDTLYLGVAGSGTRLLNYTYTDSFGCSETTSAFYTIHAPPVVSAVPMASICQTDAPFALSNGSPTGGTYSGTGVQSGIFDPSTAGPGVHPVTYSYTNSTGCTDSTTFNITVTGQPLINFPAISNRCTNDAPLELNFATPSGGGYSGPGVSSGYFFPGNAGPGIHALVYSFVDSNGCAGTDTSWVTVDSVTNSSLQPLPALCLDASPIPLNQGSPVGGVYYGIGVVGNQFDPAVSGIGTHQISYVVTNAAGCSDTSYQNITVHPLPDIQWTTANSVCINNGPISIAGATPTGGTYSGPGVIGSTFNPAAAGVGTHTITYSYTNVFQCTKDTTIQIQVTPTPSISISSFPVICEKDSVFSLTPYATPQGGYWTGTGVTTNGNEFDPQDAAAGTHTLIYHYSDANGCSSTQSVVVQVSSNPPIPLIIQSGSYLYCNWGFYDYQWSIDGQNIDTATGQTILATQSGTYVVVITNSFGCSSTSSGYFTYGVGIDEEENALKLYPNPANRSISIEGLVGDNCHIQIINAMGQIVYNEQKSLNNERVQISTSDIASGVYTILLNNSGNTYRLPVIIQH
jgi:hypothetical protein